MRVFLTAILIFFCLVDQAQGFRVKHYLPGTQNNTAKAIFESSPGNYITGGIVVDSVNGIYSNRLCLMGLNAQGQILWTKKYGNSKFEYLDNGFITRSYYKTGNHLYYTGCVRDSNNKYIGVLIKFNLTGDSLWQKIYRDAAEDVIPQMVTSSTDGGFLMTGFFQNWNTNISPCLLIKTDNNGSELWRKKINKVTPNTQDGKAIVQDSASKKIIIIGYQYIGNANSGSIYDNLLILDSLGVKLGQYNYMNMSGSLMFDLIQTKDKKFVAVGTKRQPNMIGAMETYKSFAIKFDANAPGTAIWTKEFDVYSQDNLFSCVNEFSNGDLLLSGHLDTLLRYNIEENVRVKFIRTDKNGNVIWKRYYDYATNPSNFISITSAGIGTDNCILASIGSYNSPSPNPFFFVKYDSLGCDRSLAYCQAVAAGIDRPDPETVTIRIYPNPGKGSFHVSLPDQSSAEVLSLTVSDLSGRELHREKFNSEEEKHYFDLTHLSNGVYLVTIRNKNSMVYKGKIVKQE